MPDTDIVSTITLRLVSDITEQLTRDDAALTTFAAKVDALKAGSLASIGAPTNGSNGHVAELAAIDTAALKTETSTNGVTASLSRSAATFRAEWRAAVAQGADELMRFNAVSEGTQARIDSARVSMDQYANAVSIVSGKEAELAAAAQAKADKVAASAAAASDAETVSALKSSEAQIAASERSYLTVVRNFERQAAAAKVAAEKQAAAFDKYAVGTLTRPGGLLLDAAAVGGSIDLAVKWQKVLQTVQGNTGATNAQMKLMEATILDLGSRGPAALDDIAQGFRHVSDLGYRGQQGVTVLTEAWKGAIATGGKVEDVANALATILGNQHATAARAAHDIDVIVTAAQQGNLTIPDFANNFSKIGTIAGSVHQPLEQVAAAFSTVSRATADPALAQTYMQGMLTHIIAPTGPAIKVMDELAKKSGVDLPAAFQAFSNGSMSLHDVLLKVKEATHGNAEEIFKLLGGIRGGQAGLVLINNHWEDYNKILGLTYTANNHVNASFEAMQKTGAAQLGTLKNDAQELGISVGTVLLPAFTDLVGILRPAVTDLKNFNEFTHGGVSQTLAYGLALGGSLLIIGKVAKAIDGIAVAWRAATVAEGTYNAGTLGTGAATVLKAGRFAAPAATALAANPLTAIAAGSVALGYVAYSHKDPHADEEAKLIDQYASSNESVKQLQASLDKLKQSELGWSTSLQLSGALLTQVQGEREKYRKETAALTAEYEKGTLSTADYMKALAALGPNFAVTTQAEIEASKAGKEHALTAGLLAMAGKNVGDAFREARFHLLAANEAAARTAKEGLSAVDKETKLLLVDTNQYVDQGLLKEQAAFKTMADSAIAQAKRMRAGVEAEAKAMQVAITSSVAWTPLIQPPTTQITPSSALNNHQASFGPVGTQFPTSGPSYNPSGAQTMDPALAASMSGLTSAIHALPPEFQGAFDGELSKYRQQQTDLYNTFLSSLNKENKTYAAAINSTNADYHAKVAANFKDANAKEVAENTRYLNAVDALERGYNTKLQQIMNGFLVSYQTLLVNYQAAIAAAQTKAQTDATNHEDRLQQLKANEDAALAAAKTDADKATIKEAYAKGLQLIDAHYKGIVSANETHVKNLSTAFTNHAQALDATINKQIANAKLSLVSGEKNLAATHGAALEGIKRWLSGQDTGAAAARDKALAKLEGIHIKHVNGITEVFDKHGKLLEKWGKAQSTPEALLKTIGANNDTEYNKALAKATLDILEHGKATRADIDALQSAQAGRTELQNAENAATLLATANLNDLAASISALNTVVDQKENAAAGLLYAGMQNRRIGPGTTAQQQRASILRGEGLPDDRPSDYSTDINAAIAAQNTSNAQQQSRTIVNAQVMAGSGDVAGAYAALLPLYQQGKISLTDFLGTANAATAATDAETQQMIKLGRAQGDYLSILDQSKQAYLKGTESLDTYVGDVKAAAAQTTANNVLLEAAAKRTGDWTAAAGYALTAYEQGTGTFQDAVETQKQANAATKARTDKDWDVAFAAGDVATKSQMLSAAFSGLISQASTIASAQQAVDNAKLGVIAAESAVQVQLLQSEVTATQDLGGIITAQAGIQKAISDGQISAINDSTTIMQSSYGVEVAQAAVGQALLTGNSLTIAIANAGLKVVQDELQISRVTAEMDAANARWSIRIAEDQARLAMDKLITDNANSAAQARVLMDHLQVARDAVDIALAQQKLTIDSMVILANIDSTLGGVSDYRALITGDLDALNKAQKRSTADQYKEAYDQASANQIAAQGGLTLAGDQNALNTDNASAASVSQAFLLQIAELKKAMAGDTIDQQRLQAIQASLSNIEKSADTIAAATKASEELLDRIRDLNNRGLEGLDRIDVTGSSTATMTNRLGAQMAQNPTHG